MIKLILKLIAVAIIFMMGAIAGPSIFNYLCLTKEGIFCLL